MSTYAQAAAINKHSQYDSRLGSMSKNKLPTKAIEYFKKMGRVGGLLGGKARASKLTPEQRSESARKAAKARWEKVKNV